MNIRLPRYRQGSRSVGAERTGPGCQPSVAGCRELPEASGLDIQNPDGLGTATVGCESDVARIRRPRRVLVLSNRGETADAVIVPVHDPDLEIAILLLVGDHPSVRTPVRAGVIDPCLWGSRCFYTLVRSVEIGGIDLRSLGAGGDVGDARTIGAQNRLIGVEGAVHGKLSDRRGGVEL